ncbi:MAG: orotate phosphoribosyltransferase [Actinomycetota bacterium]
MSPDSTPKRRLVEHLREHAVRTDGPFTLRSGAVSDWYIDARQTTFDGPGAIAAGEAVLDVLALDVTAVGGLTMGADPVAIATAVAAAHGDRPLRAFSVRKERKAHGTGGRLVGPVGAGDTVAVLEDTTTTGSAMFEAIDVLVDAGIAVAQVVVLVDRSAGRASAKVAERGIDYVAIVTPSDLGVES